MTNHTLTFLVAIEPGDQCHAFGVVVPDLPGCYSAGDTMQEALVNVRDAIEMFLEDDGAPSTVASPQSAWRADPRFAGWLWAEVTVTWPIDIKR